MQENNSPKTQAVVKKNEIYVSVKRKKSTIEYEKDLKNLQIELLKFQNHVKAKGLKVLILIEGRDAAGKGGAIKRLIEHLIRVVAALWLLKNLVMWKKHSGIFSVI